MEKQFLLDVCRSKILMNGDGKENEILSILLPYLDEVEKNINGNNLICFISAIEKDLFYKFKADPSIEYKEIDSLYGIYYQLIGESYSMLDDYKNGIKYLRKAYLLDPMNQTISNSYISTLVDDVEQFHPELLAIVSNECKFALSKEQLSTGLFDFGNVLFIDDEIEAAMCCFVLSNQICENELVTDAISQLDRYVSVGEVSSRSIKRKLSSKFKFPLGFDESVKRFILELATSALANKNEDAFIYYLSFLADMDDFYKTELDNYNETNKTTLKPNPKPINTYYDNDLNEEGITPFEEDTDDELSIVEFLNNNLQYFESLKEEGLSTREAKKETIEQAYCLYEDVTMHIVYMFYLYKALKLKVPENLMDDIKLFRNVSAESFSKLYGDVITEFQKNNEYSKEVATVLFLNFAIRNYEKIGHSFEEVIFLALFYGYHYSIDFLLADDINMEEVGFVNIFDDDDNECYIDLDDDEKPVIKIVEKKKRKKNQDEQ